MSDGLVGWTTTLTLLQKQIGDFQEAHFEHGTWTPDQYLVGIMTAVGEVADVRKRVYRGQLTEDEAKAAMAPELADVLMYTILMAWRSGIDIGEAFTAKVAEIHRRVHETEHYGPMAKAANQ